MKEPIILKYTIEAIAAEFDRLCPSQVSDDAGHIGHTHPDRAPSVGWFCDGGNIGNHVCEIPRGCIDGLYEKLAELPDGDLDDGGIDDIVILCGGVWEV